MTNIDDSNNTPLPTAPGYWFGEIESRLRDRMRDALAEQGLRRGGWRLLHSLSDGPATAAELAERLPRGRHGRGRGHDRDRGADRDRRAEFARGGCSHAGFDPREFRGHRPQPFGRPQGAWTYSRETWHTERPTRPGSAPHEHPEGAVHDKVREQHGRGDHHCHDGNHTDQHRHGDHDGHPSYEAAFERGFRHGFSAALAFGVAGPFARPDGFRGTDGFRGADGFRGGRGFGPHPRQGHGHGRCGADRRTGRVERVLVDFTERGWVWFDEDRATLTDEGRAAHDAAFAAVREVRETLAEGVSPEDYATTLATLEAMARNLGWEPRERGGTDRSIADEADAGGSDSGQAAAGEGADDGPAQQR